MTTTTANLRDLANFIEAHVDQKNLDMEHYCDYMVFVDDEDIDPEKANHLLNAHTCETSACALGWGTALWPDAAKASDDWVLFGVAVFPDLYKRAPKYAADHWMGWDTTEDWSDVFSPHLSSDKEDVVRRLRDKADELEARA